MLSYFLTIPYANVVTKNRICKQMNKKNCAKTLKCTLLLGKNGLKELAQQGFICNDFSQCLKLATILGVGNPELEVSALAIFLSKVFYAAGKVLFACKSGVVQIWQTICMYMVATSLLSAQ